ncbi:unnamed protein product [Rotaria sp. Silwood1]|nr:unnamed protein product [Rotaria sp. Silwood1]CAF1006932.1 unnamed protein product [Rotaria sp. Silwood1]CAF3431114.1 unnamed protein product [Rotaria sp. Silwood1]CAF4664034.1 unnamed protein product [Rotaria sp. Silwood1]
MSFLATTSTQSTGKYTGITGSGQSFNNMQSSVVLMQIVHTNFTLSWCVIRTFAFDFAPGSTPIADGRLLSISLNRTLFSIIGTTYGGDGTSNFALPNLQGIAMIGSDLSSYTLGSQTGSQQITLTINQMPAHIHSIPSSTQSTGVTGASQSFNNLQLSLPVNYIICTSGYFPSPDSTVQYPFLGQIVALIGNSIPNGWTLANGNLLSIAQNTALFAVIGTTYGGDGRSNFALPDLRGRVGVGVATGSNLQLGGKSGTESITLLSTNLPSHQHSLLSNTYGNNQTSSTGDGQSFENVQPSLGINYMVSLSGVYPSRDGGTIDSQTPVLGEIVGFAGNYVPQGWSRADGSLLSISSNIALFSLLQTYYGGDGKSSFALPDLRDRVIVGSGEGFTLGAVVGSSEITLATDQLLAHAHSLPN